MSEQPVPQPLSTRFLSVAARPQSYLNVLYLLLAFPLGIAYFAFLVTGISAGFGLLIIWVGVPFLALVLTIAWGLRQFERVLAVRLLKEDISPAADEHPDGPAEGANLSTAERRFIGAWRRSRAHLSDRLTWTGIVYLLLKFPLGTASFVVTVTLISISFALLATPVLYLVTDSALPAWTLDLSSIEGPSGWDLSLLEELLSFSGTDIDTFWESLVFTLAGVPMALVTLHLLNGAAFLQGRLARVMLGRSG